MADPDMPQGKLPFFPTIRDTLHLTSVNSAPLFRIAWPWLLTLGVVAIPLYWALHPYAQSMMSGGRAMEFEAANVSTYLLSGLIGSGIAVPWHRVLLLGESSETARNSTTADRIVRYFAFGTLLILPMSLLSFASTLIPDSSITKVANDSSFAGVLWPVVAVTFLVLLLLYARLLVKLPAIALGHDNIALRDVWARTHGNSIRLLALLLAVTVPLFWLVGMVVFTLNEILSPLTGSMTDILTDRVGYTLTSAAMEVVAMLIGAYAITALSLSFRHFFGPSSPVTDNAQSAAKQ